MPDNEQDARVLLAESLFNDPETRGVMQELIAKKHPKAVTAMPDFVARKATEDLLAKDREERERDRQERNKFYLDRARDEERKKIIDAGLATEQEIPAIEKLMVDRNTADYEVAARAYRAMNPPVAAPRSDVRGMRVPGVGGAGGDEFKGIVENTEEWARDRAHEIMADFAAGRGAKWM